MGRISEPSTLNEILNEGGVLRSSIMTEPGTLPIASPEDWWTTLLGSGYRGTIEQLESETIEYVRQANLSFVQCPDTRRAG